MTMEMDQDPKAKSKDVRGPNGTAGEPASTLTRIFHEPHHPPPPPPAARRLTVWCKSLLFHGRGYTVFDDSDGRVVFRVDNYAHDWRQEMALMDCSGNVLLTVRRRRKIFSLGEMWEVHKGDTGGVLDHDQAPLLKATKALGDSSCKVSVATHIGAAAAATSETSGGYRMSWSRREECSKIYRTASHELLVAEISRKFGSSNKTLLDKDVLALVVQPGMDQAIAMAMIMIINCMRRTAASK